MFFVFFAGLAVGKAFQIVDPLTVARCRWDALERQSNPLPARKRVESPAVARTSHCDALGFDMSDFFKTPR